MNTKIDAIKHLGKGAEATVYECVYKDKPAAVKLFTNSLLETKA